VAVVLEGIEEPEDNEVLRTINISDIFDNGDNFDDSSEIKLPNTW
jgi:hypothetical protein